MIPNPWIIVGVLVAWIASLAGVGYWQNQSGHIAERVSWQAQDSANLKAANAKILTLEESARVNEQAHAAVIAALDAQYTKELQDAAAQKDRDVAAARAGALKLRYATESGAGGGKLPDAPASTGPGNGPSGSELPPETTASLYALADDADQVAKQLASCQAIVEADRK